MSESKNNSFICPKCRANIDWIDPLFCPYCDTILNNYCTNNECDMCIDSVSHEEDFVLHQDFKFCPDCGAKTLYYDFLSLEDE